MRELWTSTNGITHKITYPDGRTLCLSATGRSIRQDQAQHKRNCKRCFNKKYIAHKRRVHF